jgi:hypothetical protein
MYCSVVVVHDIAVNILDKPGTVLKIISAVPSIVEDIPDTVYWVLFLTY